MILLDKRVLAMGFLSIVFLSGCIAGHTFPIVARAGDTIILPVGWNKNLTRDNVTITIQPSSGSPITYAPGNSNVRAIVNLYPDPLSRLIIGSETQQELGYNADSYGALIQDQITNQDRDWWNTVVYFKLPSALPTGTASVFVSGPAGLVTQEPSLVEIIPGKAAANDPLDTKEMASMIGSLERGDHHTVNFTGSIVPHSIQIELGYSAVAGKPWVVNPRGDIKNLAWSDTGSSLRVVLTPSNGQTPAHLAVFKFYVAGQIQGVQVIQVKAYDLDGNLIPDIRASIE